MKKLLCLALILISILAILPSCGSQGLLQNASLSADSISPNGKGVSNSIDLNYGLGQPAKVSISVQDSTGKQYAVRTDIDRQPGDYTLDFRGVVPEESTGAQRVLPDGDYKFILSATGSNGEGDKRELSFKITNADTVLPEITGSSAFPETITPNYDALDDVSLISFKLSKEADVSVFIGKPDGERYIIKSYEKAEPGEYKVTFNGQSAKGKLLDNGEYQYFIVAKDAAGNEVTSSGPLNIQDGGQPQIKVVDVQFTPTKLMKGETVHVTIRLKNTGKVTLRSQGPEPGFTYTTNDTFASVNNGEFVDQPGLWRVGVDWDGNAGSGPRRYPFRWGFGKDLAPGEEATVTGNITILQNEREMSFYAGVIQEGIGFPADKLGRTLIEVGL